MSKPSGLMHLFMQIFSKPFKLLFHASHFLADFVRDHFIPTMHDLTQTLKKPSSLQEKWESQSKRIIYITNNRKHASPCHWQVFQINLNFITSFSASQKIPNALSIGRFPIQSLSFTPFLLSALGV